MPFRILCLFILIPLYLFVSCTDDIDNGIPEVVSISDSSVFDEELEASYTLDSNYTLDLWAPGPLLSNAVAISFDHHGNAYVTETTRRKSSDLDIRQHRGWMVEDLALQSINDTREFHKHKLATKLSDENKWMEDFNGDSIHDYRDLEIQSEIVKKIYDSDGDGRADASHIYAAGINSMLTGVAAGVLAYNDDVFVTAAPKVYKMKDVDGDGDADQREIISSGYGIHIAFAGHDMSGLIMGPDGKVYWSIGDLGVNVTDNNGKKWFYPNQGAAMRCNPDGSDFEVFAHGLRNTQELAFDVYGNLISVDNDGDHPGERERYVHILEGSDTGWRINWQYGKYNQPYNSYKVWMDEGLHLPYFEGQAAYIIPALALAQNGPAGLAYNPGTALGNKFNNTFYSSHFTGNSKNSKLISFQIKPKGSTFEIINENEVSSGINSTGINFGPDGALYINDWKNSYSKKDAGRIWKLDTNQKNDNRSQTATILKSRTENLDVVELIELLHNQDMRIRAMAQFALVAQNRKAQLLREAEVGKTLLGRLHAIWGYGQLMRNDPELGKNISFLLFEENEHVKSQVAKVLGDAKHEIYGASELLTLLNDNSDHVKRYAAEALGKINYKAAIPDFIKLLHDFGENKDAHMRHTVSFALSKIATEKEIANLSNMPSHDIRIGAVLALRHQKSEEVALFVNDEHEWVATEAARAIHDDFSIPNAMVPLAESLNQLKHRNEAFVRRAINANLRVGDGSSAERLASYFLNSRNPEDMRMQALWTLGSFANPSVLDRVDNRHREIKPGDVSAAKNVFRSIYQTIDQQENAEIKSMIITVAGKLGFSEVEESIFSFISKNQEDNLVRVAALAALSSFKSNRLTDAIFNILENDDINLRKEALKIIDKTDVAQEDKIFIITKVMSTGSVSEKQSALQSLSNIKIEKSIDLLKSLIQKLSSLESGIQLDVINTAYAQNSQELNILLNNYENAKDSNNKLEQYRETLYGGNSKNGQDIFAFNEAAQCLRCHNIQGYGGEVGPAMDNIGNELSREELLLSLVDPNSRIAPGYGNIYFTLKDGTEIAGIVTEQSNNTIIIKDAGGKNHSMLKSSIVSQENLPSGMLSQESLLTKNEIRDLVAFLITLRN